MLGRRLDDKSLISAAWEAQLNEPWVPVNKDLYIVFPVKINAPALKLNTDTGLTGYLKGNEILVDMTPVSDDRLDGKFLAVPDAVRGMEDAAVEYRNGQKWLRLDGYLYRPLSGVPLLTNEIAAISIGNERFATWFRLPS